MEPEPVIYRAEVTAILGVLADLNVNVKRIVDLLEEADGEEEDQENDA